MPLDPATGKTELVQSDPLGKVDFGGAMFSAWGNYALFVDYSAKLNWFLPGAMIP
jgi:hypothetical protein